MDTKSNGKSDTLGKTSYADRKEKYLLLVGAIASFISGFKACFNIYITTEYVNNMVQWEKNNLANISSSCSKFDNSLVESMYPLFTASCITGLLFFTTTFIAYSSWEIVSISLVQKLKKAYLQKVLSQNLDWIENNKNKLIHHLNNEMEMVKNAYNSMALLLVDSALIWLSSSIIVGIYAPTTILVFIAFEVWCTAVNYSLTTCNQIFCKEEKRIGNEFAHTINEVFSNLRTVVSFGGEKNECARFYELDKKGNVSTAKKALSTSILTSFLNLVKMVQYAAALYILADLYTKKQLSFAFIQTVTVQLPHMMKMKAAVALWANFKQGVDSGLAILQVIDSPIHSNDDQGVNLQYFKGDIKFDNLDFNYPKTSKPIFDKFNLSIRAGEVIVFVGKSGSGKSTLFNLLTRFYDPTSGKILLDGVNISTINKTWLRENIGVVSQEPVLFDASIEENIKIGKPNASFEDVEMAARLANATEFIYESSEGYKTNALKLSGGQKQRIAIARALIRNPKVLLLDEATSALDSTSEKLVQNALNAAFKGRTVLTVAHKLSTVVHADRIYVLREGKIVESGTYDELVALGAEFTHLFNATAEIEDPDATIPKIGLVVETKASCFPHVAKPLKGLSPPNYVLIAGGIASLLLTLLIPLDLTYFAYRRAEIFELFNYPMDAFLQILHYYVKVLLIVSTMTSLLCFFVILIYCYVSRKLTSRLTLSAFRSLLCSDLTSFKPADTINTLICSQGKIKEVAFTLWLTCSEFAFLVIVVVATLLLNWRMAIIAITVNVLIMIGVPSKMFIMKYFKTAKTNDNPVNVALESLQKIKTVQLLSLQNYMISKYINIPKDVLRYTKANIFLYCGQQTINSGLISIASSTIFLIGAYLLEKCEMRLDEVQSGNFLCIVSCANSLILTAHLYEITGGITAVKKLREIAKPKKKANVSLPITTTLHRGSIEFRNVNFSYDLNSERKTLDNINLTIKAGQTIGIVGKSGSGKTTLVSLIEKFIEPTSGEILVDGININNYDTTYLRSRIGIVSQEPVLFNTSIRDNITYGVASQIKSASEEDVIAAAKAVGIHQFITNLPLGYDTPVGEYGSHLSGGQKQRVAIARAFIRKPNIVILDEATSALDNRTEKSVREALEKLCSDRTTLIIAHRLSTVRHADVIVVFSQGRIVEKGKYEELVENKGFFYDLVKSNEA